MFCCLMRVTSFYYSCWRAEPNNLSNPRINFFAKCQPIICQTDGDERETLLYMVFLYVFACIPTKSFAILYIMHSFAVISSVG